jgi:hypothetical protein
VILEEDFEVAQRQEADAGGEVGDGAMGPRETFHGWRFGTRCWARDERDELGLD